MRLNSAINLFVFNQYALYSEASPEGYTFEQPAIRYGWFLYDKL